MNEIVRGSSRRVSVSKLPATLLAAVLISAVGAGCIDGTAADQTASEASLQLDDRAQPGTPVSLQEIQRRLAAAHSSKPSTAEAEVTPADIACVLPLSLFSLGNSRYVSAELSYGAPHTAELRARATAVGPWEQYELCFDSSDGSYQLFSLGNSSWVSAELSYGAPNTGELRARATVAGPWERFFIGDKDGGTLLLSAASNLYVAAELDFADPNKGMLRARTPASALGTWELFQFRE
jgi:hypothetical protein